MLRAFRATGKGVVRVTTVETEIMLATVILLLLGEGLVLVNSGINFHLRTGSGGGTWGATAG